MHLTVHSAVFQVIVSFTPRAKNQSRLLELTQISAVFKRIEKKWLSPLYHFCAEKFCEIYLASHDQTHHFRVWLLIKELMETMQQTGMEVTESDVEKAILATFFHDLGMIETLGKEHGRCSRVICESFFLKQLTTPLDFEQVLLAIEHHGSPAYRSEIYDKSILPQSTLAMLCIGDDLDAFGALGVFRYLEIYLMRGISTDTLPQLVIEDVRERYNGFQMLCSSMIGFINKHRKRYAVTENFFQELQQQIRDIPYLTDRLTGPLGVLHFLMGYGRDRRIALPQITELALEISQDNYVIGFFQKLEREIASFHASERDHDSGIWNDMPGLCFDEDPHIRL